MKAPVVGAIVGVLAVALLLILHGRERNREVASRSRSRMEEAVHLPFREEVRVQGSRIVVSDPPPAGEVQVTNAPELNQPIEQFAFRLEQRFLSEAAPTRESLTFGTVIRSEVEEALVEGARVESVDCRELSCRLVIVFPSLEADKQAFENFGKATETAIGRYGFIAPERVTADDGSLRTTLYVSKSPSFSLE